MDTRTPNWRFARGNRSLVGLFLLGLSLALVLPGCGGCSTEDPTEAELEDLRKKKEEKKKDLKPLEFKTAESVPRDTNSAQILIKPGHWVSLIQNVQVNDFEQIAELRGTVLERNGDPISTEHTKYSMTNFRPAPLPKATLKRFESEVYIPRRPVVKKRNKRIFWVEKLLRTKSGRRLAEAMYPTVSMPSYQYFMFVLASVPSAYGYVERLESVQPINDTVTQLEPVRYYRVVMPKKGESPPLPSHPLTWTNIGYVVWDRYDPQLLTPAQRESMVDWLHWGGQLIVSGPDTLNTLRSSFLGPYLPAEIDRTVPLKQAAFDEMNARWSLESVKRKIRLTIEVVDDNPLVGVQFKKHAQAQEVPGTGGLVVERRVGSGRIVVTSFRLSDQRIINWRSFDSFFNNALLRRPRRKYMKDGFGQVKLGWHNAVHHPLDPRFSTRVRYFSRDISSTKSVGALAKAGRANTFEWDPEQEVGRPVNNRPFGGRFAVPQQANPPVKPFEIHGDKQDEHQLGHAPSRGAGVAGWNDRSGASDAARQSLIDAAGISIPKAKFVFRILLVYLIVLVPVNWGFFRLIGRVEWAWVAAPIIAIGGAVAVVKLAQLDIGFARSRNEIAVIEIQSDYHRAHLTRYIALYTSLATPYEMSFKDRSTIAQPFSVNPSYRRGIHDVVTTVALKRDAEVDVSGYKVNSNSTGMLHAEQMLELGGKLRLTKNGASEQVQNSTMLSLRDVGVVRRRLNGKYEVAWIGELGSQESKPLTFSGASRAWLGQWDASSVASNVNDAVTALIQQYDKDRNGRLSADEVASSPEWAGKFEDFDTDNNDQLEDFEISAALRMKKEGSINLGPLFELAATHLTLRPGETRLIGWTSEDPEGLQIRPNSTQKTFRGLVLAHLKLGAMADAKPDSNSRYDVDDDYRYDPLKEKDVQGAE